MGDFDDSEFLKLANAGEGPSASIDRMKKNTEGEGKGSSFWEKGMEGLIPEAFKGGDKKGKGPQKTQEVNNEERERASMERERSRLIRKHNAYLRSDSIRKILVDSGYHCQNLLPNTPLSTVKAQLDEINSIRNTVAARQMAAVGMDQLNKLTESMIPSLKSPISFRAVWNANAAKEGSQIQLDMEELAIELEPYITTGFWGRFAMDYFMMIQQVQALASSPEIRAQMAAQEALSNQYDSDTENNLQSL